MPVGALSVVFHSCVQPQMGFGFPDLNPRALRTFHLLSVGVHGQLRADITRESPHPSDSGSASLLDFLSLLLLPVHFGFMSKFHQDLLVHLADLLPSLLDFFCVGMEHAWKLRKWFLKNNQLSWISFLSRAISHGTFTNKFLASFEDNTSVMTLHHLPHYLLWISLFKTTN